MRGDSWGGGQSGGVAGTDSSGGGAGGSVAVDAVMLSAPPASVHRAADAGAPPAAPEAARPSAGEAVAGRKCVRGVAGKEREALAETPRPSAGGLVGVCHPTPPCRTGAALVLRAGVAAATGASGGIEPASVRSAASARSATAGWRPSGRRRRRGGTRGGDGKRGRRRGPPGCKGACLLLPPLPRRPPSAAPRRCLRLDVGSGIALGTAVAAPSLGRATAPAPAPGEPEMPSSPGGGGGGEVLLRLKGRCRWQCGLCSCFFCSHECSA